MLSKQWVDLLGLIILEGRAGRTRLPLAGAGIGKLPREKKEAIHLFLLGRADTMQCPASLFFIPLVSGNGAMGHDS